MILLTKRGSFESFLRRYMHQFPQSTVNINYPSVSERSLALLDVVYKFLFTESPNILALEDLKPIALWARIFQTRSFYATLKFRGNRDIVKQ